MLTITAAVVVLAVVGVMIALDLGDSTATTQPVPVTSSTPTSMSPAVTPKASTQHAEGTAPPKVRPLNLDWQAVAAAPDIASAAYDVPKDGWYTKPGLYVSWSDSNDKELISVVNAAAYDLGYCKALPRSALATVGFFDIGTRDPVQAAPLVARKFAKAIALKKDNTSYAPIGAMTTEQISVQGIPAVEAKVVTTIGAPEKGACTKTVEVRALGVTMGSRSTMLVLTRDLGHQNSLSDKQADAVMQTLRPVVQ